MCEHQDILCLVIFPLFLRPVGWLCASQFESSTSPPATSRAFELLKIGLFKFPPLGAKKPFKCRTN